MGNFEKMWKKLWESRWESCGEIAEKVAEKVVWIENVDFGLWNLSDGGGRKWGFSGFCERIGGKGLQGVELYKSEVSTVST